jgi:diphosphomevalonate decarboxylase
MTRDESGSGTAGAEVTARAGTNIGLVKYWGKRDAALNLPASGSLSLTLAELGTTTRVRFLNDRRAGAEDRVVHDGLGATPAFAARVSRFLDLVRQRARMSWPAEVFTRNTVPTASGLASSASGFAALCLAATRAAGLALGPDELSALARRGSGSAARSIHAGFVEMAAGIRSDGTDAIARPLLAPESWAVRLVVAVTSTLPKTIGSTEAMDTTASSSPFYRSWLETVERDLGDARAAIEARDLQQLGPVIERSALRMHATAMAAEPPILYWNPATLAAIRAVQDAREAGGPVGYFTIDAGPHVKVLCRASDAPVLAALLETVPGVRQTLIARPGPGVMTLDRGDDEL